MRSLTCDLLIFGFYVAVIFINFKSISSHLIWTPILPAQPDQVDLWTLSQSGCSCKDGSGGRGGGECACCVPRAACPCAEKNPHRCAQCGLQQHCNNMCNMTIDGALLSVSAGTLEGSLISPSKPGPPIYCWYSLRAPPGHRVEVQLHRLVHIGSFLNNTICRGGYVEVSDEDLRSHEDRFREETDVRWNKREGANWQQGRNAMGWSSRRGRTSFKICGQDQRLHPPIVLFSDSGIATILYRVSDKTGSPRFIAYYNFPPATHPVTGDKQWGGTRIEYTDCDWLYQDVHCRNGSECHLTSPGYPGIYPSETKCKYLFTMGSPTTKGTVTFISVDLPAEKCSTDYISIYAGTSTSSPLITKLCGTSKKTINFQGPSVLLLFSSGPFLTPFQFNGFHASLFFYDYKNTSSTENSPVAVLPAKHPNRSVLSDPSGVQVGDKEDCLRVFWSNGSRSGHFDTSSYTQTHSYFLSSSSFASESSSSSISSTPSASVFGRKLKAAKLCRLRFIGHADEVIQISFFKYELGGKSCSSEVSIFDGVADKRSQNIFHHICGPVAREPKDSKGRFVQPEFLISSSNLLEVHLRFGKGTDPERQFLTGAYQFHSSRLEGTKKPDSVCDVMFYGANSPRNGEVRQPKSALLWNIEGVLTCSYFFVPGANQSLQLTVASITGTRGSGHCETKCVSEGCQCHPNQVSLRTVDHLLLTDSKRDKVIACFCGDVRSLTPVTILSTSGIDVRYHVGRYSWSAPGFNFTLSYQFPPPTLCGNEIHNTPAGLLVPPSDSAISPSIFIFTSCSWVIENQIETHLTVVVQPPSEGSCATWNLTVEARLRGGDDRTLGSVCGGSSKGNFYLVPTHSAAILHLHRGGRTIRDWLLTWHTRRSGVDIADTDQFTPKPELSRTLHGQDTGRTFIVRSASCEWRFSVWLLLLDTCFLLLFDRVIGHIYLESLSLVCRNLFYFRDS